MIDLLDELRPADEVLGDTDRAAIRAQLFPGEAVVVPLRARRRGAVRRGPWLAAAAVVAVAGLGATWAAVSRHTGATTPASAPTSTMAATAAAPAFRFDTQGIVLEAQSITADVAGAALHPSPTAAVDVDPGDPNGFTELYLTWPEGSVTSGISLAFRSDGTSWWIDMVRTFHGEDGKADHEQIGHWYATPLGTPITGDIELPGVTLHGASLEAFRRPAACTNPTAPFALVASYPVVDSWVGGYGTTYSVWDTATCRPMDVRDFTFEYTSDHPEVAAIGDTTRPSGSHGTEATLPGGVGGSTTTVFGGDDYPSTLTRMELQLLAPGTATIHAVARDATGNVIGEVDSHVTVQPGGDGQVVTFASLPSSASIAPANP